ncbi:MAG: hypothetical protein BWY69_00395 [Planctomycetes bacterium ADurb.Bin401]|nr:MAG: hypothetical protein BWY69_00395 [Planctomycetes bacterium ADurb.Bin401]
MNNRNRDMANKNIQIDGKKAFLGILFVIGGCLMILIPPTMVMLRVARSVLGIILVMQGTIFLWEATKCWREKKKETKDADKNKL